MPSNQLNKLFTAILFPLILGLIYNNLGNEVPLIY